MDDVRWPLYLSALPTGLLFGYVMQRGGFCLTRALSNLVLARDATLVRGYVLALLVAMIGVHGGTPITSSSSFLSCAWS